jgi:antitoxin (DNA-binding transcriptional repressor) of toxin-antitoxin stability system
MIETHSEPFVRENDDMAVLHITEAELARDIHGVLEKIRQGAEIIVEHEHRPVARMTSVRGPGRPLSECIALADAHGSTVTLDDLFGRDLEEIIASRRDPLTSRWD